MAEIVEPLLDIGSIVGVAPADGIVSALADDGSIVVLEAWDSVQGDALHHAPAGSAIGGGTRRHLFDREVYVDSGGGAYVNVRAWGSITGTPTTVQGYGITNGIRTDQNGTIAGTLAVTSIAVSGGSSGQGKVWFSAADGLVVQGKTGSGNDLSLYTPGAGYIMRVTTGGAATAWSGNMIPISDAGNDFGGSSNRWRHGYFSGTVTVGDLVATTSATWVSGTSSATIRALTLSGGYGVLAVGHSSAPATLAASKGIAGFQGDTNLYVNALTGGGVVVMVNQSTIGTFGAAGLTMNALAISGVTSLATSGTVTMTNGGQDGLILKSTSNVASVGLAFYSASAGRRGYTAHDQTDLYVYNDVAGGEIRLFTTGGGNIRVGGPLVGITTLATTSTSSLGGDVTITKNAATVQLNIDSTAAGAGDQTRIALYRNGTVKWYIGNNILGGSGDDLTLYSAAPAGIVALSIAKTTGNITIAGSIIPGTDNAVDHGGSSNRWRDGYYGRNVTIGGTIGVTGAATLSSTLGVTGAATFSGAVSITRAQATLGITSSTGTNSSYIQLVNTGGSYFVGVEDSGGGSFGATAYAQVIYAASGKNIEFFPGSAKAVTLSAAGKMGVGVAPDASYTVTIRGAGALKIDTSAGGENGLLVANALLNVWRFTVNTLQIFGTLDVNGDITAETDNANDVGTVSHRFRDGNFARNLTVGGTLTVGSFTLPAASWTAATMLNGWTGQAYYWKDPFGIVHLSSPGGMLLNNNGAIMFVLPAGYRPSAVVRFSIHTASLVGTQIVGYCDVDTSGNVRCDNGTGYQNYTHIDGLSFAT